MVPTSTISSLPWRGALPPLPSADTAMSTGAPFISQVKALKGKKIIPASAANDLIAEAEAVQESVGCG